MKGFYRIIFAVEFSSLIETYKLLNTILQQQCKYSAKL